VSAAHPQGASPGDEDLGLAAARTGLAWSRTLMAFAGVIGLVGVRSVVLDGPALASAVVLLSSALLLLANGILTRRAWRRAAADMLAGVRTVHATPAAILAGAATAIAIAALALLATGAPPT